MFGEVAGSVIRWVILTFLLRHGNPLISTSESSHEVFVFPLGNQLVSRSIDLVPSTYEPASPLEFNEKRLAPNRPAP